MLRINQLKILVKDMIDLSKEEEKALLTKKATQKLKGASISDLQIVKKSIDARDKNKLTFIYSVDVKCKDEGSILKKVHDNNIMSTKTELYKFPYEKTEKEFLQPIIVGAGPAGYFCGLYLARAGFRPIIIERGKPVDERKLDVEAFWKGEKPINPTSNVSFGEGGAGTFSDGKLNTGIKDPNHRIDAVLADFVTFGANEDITYINKPHIGTDVLCNIMSNMRNEIISLGGEVRFHTVFTDYQKEDNKLIVSLTNNDNTYQLQTNALVIALGHSARDTFKMLASHTINMEQKAFAIGVRIEHKQSMINESQYGMSPEAKKLPAADYKMTYRSSEGRSVYSFCMCPGGFVVNASSGLEQSVVNGMSNSGRDEANANSAIVVNVTPEDFCAEGFDRDDVLAGVKYQELYENKAFIEGQGMIPVQLFKDFEDNITTTEINDIKPNIKGKYTLSNLNNCLPPYVKNAIIEGVHAYARRLRGFDKPEAVLSGIESRTSSPVRIVRDEHFMSNTIGIFPCGEGAGYAGGITSAAVDGIKVAEAVAQYILN